MGDFLSFTDLHVLLPQSEDLREADSSKQGLQQKVAGVWVSWCECVCMWCVCDPLQAVCSGVLITVLHVCVFTG